LIRINKFLAQAGETSRRAADEQIARGAVTIDGRIAKPGDRVDPTSSDVRVQGERLRPVPATHVTIALNKPLGMVTTMRDERGRPCVGDLLKHSARSKNALPRLFPVGRLDARTTGLLLLTTAGELCRNLTHPSRGVERRYRVTVNASLSDDTIRALGATRIRQRADGAVQFEMTLQRGQNREIRRACAQHGLRVVALERIAYGPIEVGNLRRGEFRYLTEREAESLARAASVKAQ